MALRLLGFAVTLGIVSQPCACTDATTGCTSEFPAKGSTCDATEGQETSMLLQPLRPSSWLEPGKAKVDAGNFSSIPAFVLNLERRKDRLGNFSRVLYEQAPWLHKITCRVAAHDGKAFGDRLKKSLIPDTVWQSAVSRDKYQNRTVGGSLTKGGVALIMGHAIMWEHLLQTQAPWGIFMEDDLTYIHPDLGSLLEKLGKSLPAPGHDWDRLQIQGEGQGLDCPNYSLQAPLHIRNGSGPTSGMYIITREAARSALEAYFPMQGGQLDNTHSFLRSQCRGHHICPIPARQPGSYKDTSTAVVAFSFFLFFFFFFFFFFKFWGRLIKTVARKRAPDPKS